MKILKSLFSLMLVFGMLFMIAACDTGNNDPQPNQAHDFNTNPNPDDLNNDDSSNDASKTYCTISYYSENPKEAVLFPSNKQVTSGYKLTAEDLPTLKPFDASVGTFSTWINADTMQPVTVGYTVTSNLTLVPKFNLPVSDNTTSEGGRKGYVTIKFDVSEVNAEYSLFLDEPQALEVSAAECGAEDRDGAFASVTVIDKVPVIADQVINGAKYKLLWEYSGIDGKQLIQNYLSSNNTTAVYSNVGSVVTLKAVLKKYATVSFTTKYGTVPDTIEMYESEQLKMNEFPVPKGSLRKVYNYKNNGVYAFDRNRTDPYYEGTGEPVTFEVEFALPRIGDIILTDGSVKSESEFNAETDKAIAVYFYLGDREDLVSDYLAVGIEKASEIEWALLTQDGLDEAYGTFASHYIYNANLTNEQKEKFKTLYYTNDYQDKDGSDNYSILKEIDPEGNYPAFEYAENFGKSHGAEIDALKTGWYLPTVSDCAALVAALKPMNSVLKKVGANFCQKSNGSIAVNDYYPWTCNTTGTEPEYCWIQPVDSGLEGSNLNMCKVNYYTNETSAITHANEKWDAFAIIKIAKD